MAPTEAETMWDQWRALLAGLATVPGPRWISHPSAIHSAENKAAQLAVARDVGLPVPLTIWTNHLDEARSFMQTARGVAAIKTVATAYWEIDGRPNFVFARRASVDDLPAADALAAAPVCVQQLINPKDDIRITVVGDRFFAAQRCVSDERILDWRLQEQAPWAPFAVSRDFGERCVALTRALGLRFAGIDVVLAADGECIFIELNPNGEWGWLQSSDLPIGSAIADELCAG